MLNIFVNSTTLGQAMGATFDLDLPGKLGDKRITDISNCTVQEPFYVKSINSEKIATYINNGLTNKVTGLGKATDMENIRVNSLILLGRELELVSSLDSNEPITCYIPGVLLDEIQSGKVKYSFGEKINPYYSEFEINAWKETLPLIQNLFMRIVFKPIDSCRKNLSNTTEQALRVNIVASMDALILKAFKARREALQNAGNSFALNNNEDAF